MVCLTKEQFNKIMQSFVCCCLLGLSQMKVLLILLVLKVGESDYNFVSRYVE